MGVSRRRQTGLGCTGKLHQKEIVMNICTICIMHHVLQSNQMRFLASCIEEEGGHKEGCMVQLLSLLILLTMAHEPLDTDNADNYYECPQRSKLETKCVPTTCHLLSQKRHLDHALTKN